jgi:hypothetical protein
MKNARSFFIAISSCLIPIIPAMSDAPIRVVRRLPQTVHISLTRRLSVWRAPVSTCLDAFVSTDRGACVCRTPATPQLCKLATCDPLLKCKSPQCRGRGHLNAKKFHMNLRWKSVVILPEGWASSRRPEKLHADKSYDHLRCRNVCLRRRIKPRVAR